MVLGHLLSHWTRNDIPSLNGRVAVVTGGNSGIGFEVARHLAQHGAAVALVGRNQQLVEWAVEDLKEEFPGADIRSFTANLEVMKEVAALARELLAAYPSIHLLVNNAGRFLDADFDTTPEGLEQTMAVNYWGHVALTTLLLDRWGLGGGGSCRWCSSFSQHPGTRRLPAARKCRFQQIGQ
jgi:NAD(P)-dependent dehydrogenase (short-subunit alcohol dehydrogenase family)